MLYVLWDKDCPGLALIISMLELRTNSLSTHKKEQTTMTVFHLYSNPKAIGVVSPVHSPQHFEASNFEFTLYCHAIHKVSQMDLYFHYTGNVRP